MKTKKISVRVTVSTELVRDADHATLAKILGEQAATAVERLADPVEA